MSVAGSRSLPFRGKLAVVCSLCLALWLGSYFSPAGGFAAWETHWVDRLQWLRLQLRGGDPVPEGLCLVVLDEASIAYLDRPEMFWVGDMARLAQAALDSGARAVAFDFIFAGSSRGVSPAVQDELSAQRERLLVTLATGKVALGDFVDSTATPGSHNHPDLDSVARSLGSLCSLNILSDPDGRYRRYLPFVGVGQKADAEPGPSLAVWLARQLGASVEWEASGLALHGQPVPLEWSGSEPVLRSFYRIPNPPLISAATLWQKLDRGQPLSELKDKVVLVAPWADSMGDFRASIYDYSSPKADLGGTRGVEHHLAALQTLLRGQPLVPYPRWLGALCSGTMWGLLLWLGLRVSGYRQALAAGCTLALHTLATAWAFLWGDLWLPFWGPVAGALLGYATGYEWRYWMVERQRRFTLDMFSRMVAPQVVEKVLSDPRLQQLGGVQRRVTVLYTDINDFTPMCEKHTPSEVIVMLNEYFEAMVSLVFQREGMLKQFVGDEIMVIYGAPMEQPDHAARAVNTALDMLEKLQEMERAAAGADGFFDIKVGINTGDVVVGHVGSHKHMEYAAVGDDVNLGARIMATTKKLGVSILVSEVTKKEAEPHLPEVEWISHGVQAFKGKTAQMEVFEVRRRRTTS